jgi:hypothetical protein
MQLASSANVSVGSRARASRCQRNGGPQGVDLHRALARHLALDGDAAAPDQEQRLGLAAFAHQVLVAVEARVLGTARQELHLSLRELLAEGLVGERACE